MPRAHIDTDQIIPKQFLKRIERTGFGQFLFYDWARDAEGELDPQFVLNRPEYRKAQVLVAGPDFGTGSSREHAPWALSDWGFEAVIAPSFGDIFRSNCLKIGLLPIALAAAEVASLLDMAAADPTAKVSIDLASQTVTAGDLIAEFPIDEHAKMMLMDGLDEIALTLQEAEQISDYEANRPPFKPAL